MGKDQPQPGIWADTRVLETPVSKRSLFRVSLAAAAGAVVGGVGYGLSKLAPVPATPSVKSTNSEASSTEGPSKVERQLAHLSLEREGYLRPIDIRSITGFERSLLLAKQIEGLKKMGRLIDDRFVLWKNDDPNKSRVLMLWTRYLFSGRVDEVIEVPYKTVKIEGVVDTADEVLISWDEVGLAKISHLGTDLPAFIRKEPLTAYSDYAYLSPRVYPSPLVNFIKQVTIRLRKGVNPGRIDEVIDQLGIELPELPPGPAKPEDIPADWKLDRV